MMVIVVVVCCGREVRVRLVQLVLATLEVGVWDLVADLIEIKESRLEGRVRRARALQGLLDEGAEGQALLLLGTLR